MFINYIILVHRDPDQLLRLIDKLEGATTSFYIHVDKNAEIEPFKAQVLNRKNVYFIIDREEGTWGDLGIVKATINGLQQIIDNNRTGYCILMSGQDYPIKSNAVIEAYLSKNYGVNFINTWALPSDRWFLGGLNRIHYYKFSLSNKVGHYILLPPVFSKAFMGQLKISVRKILTLVKQKKITSSILKKRDFPNYLKPYGGSQWWALPIETARKVILFLQEHKDYLNYHRFTLLPDEIFFQSIIEHLAQTESLIINPSLTYVRWEGSVSAHPITFNLENKEELLSLNEEKMFARKFDLSLSLSLLDSIDAAISSNNKQLHKFA